MVHHSEGWDSEKHIAIIGAGLVSPHAYLEVQTSSELEVLLPWNRFGGIVSGLQLKKLGITNFTVRILKPALVRLLLFYLANITRRPYRYMRKLARSEGLGGCVSVCVYERYLRSLILV
jgi:hypothetical protein